MRRIPAVWMRGGSSKGLFIEPRHLPSEPKRRDRLLLRALGSPDPWGGQLDGVGGGTSSTSKVALVAPSPRDDADVDFAFGHVALDRPLIDWSGNCGNLVAAVALYAVEAGWVAGAEGVATVRIWQVATRARIDVDVPLAGGEPALTGGTSVDGVPALDGGGHPDYRIRYLRPGRDGAVLPTGRARQDLHVDGLGRVAASLVDAGNPAVLVRAEALGLSGVELPAELERSELAELVERLRRAGALAMGLVATDAAAAERPATPKVVVLAPPADHVVRGGHSLAATEVDLVARVFSMGRAHHAFTGTGAIALAAAAVSPGTLVAELLGGSRSCLTFGHAAGLMSLEAAADSVGRVAWVQSHRSARRLMEGWVTVPTPAR